MKQRLNSLPFIWHETIHMQMGVEIAVEIGRLDFVGVPPDPVDPFQSSVRRPVHAVIFQRLAIDPLVNSNAYQLLIVIPVVRSEYHRLADSLTENILEVVEDSLRIVRLNIRRNIPVHDLLPDSSAGSYVTHREHSVGSTIEFEKTAALTVDKHQWSIRHFVRIVEMFFPQRPQIRIGCQYEIGRLTGEILHVGNEHPGRLAEHHAVLHFGRNEDHLGVRETGQSFEDVRKNRMGFPLVFLADDQDDALETDPPPRHNGQRQVKRVVESAVRVRLGRRAAEHCKMLDITHV